MSNYPPGMNPEEIDRQFGDDLELPEEKMQVKYELKVYCGEDEDQVYSDHFYSEESLQSDGLRKADHAIKQWRDDELDMLRDERDEDDLED